MLSGEGKAFCSGRDLSDAEPATEDAQSILADTFNPLFSRIRYFDLPTFAAVHGACLGVGLGIALACDVTIAPTAPGSDHRSLALAPFSTAAATIIWSIDSANIARSGTHLHRQTAEWHRGYGVGSGQPSGAG